MSPKNISLSGEIDTSPLQDLIKAISAAETYADFSSHILSYEAKLPYQIIHIGICKLDDVFVKDIIYSRTINNLDIEVADFSDDLKWAVCVEAEYQMQPFNLLTHDFVTSNTDAFNQLRTLAKKSGLTEIIILPVKYENTLSVAIINFPQSDFNAQMMTVLPDIYHLVVAIFNRFPSFLMWPEKGRLTPRESEILALTSTGMTESEIAAQLKISTNTVRNHVENTKFKLNARNKLHAVAIAARDHEIDLSKV